jgi:outer membrane lipoprotein-sorting protein
MRLATCFFLTLLCLRGDTLKEILDRMDAEAAKFKGLTAKLHRTEYSAAPLNETTESEGDLTVVKKGKSISALLDFLSSKTDPKQLLFRDNQYQEYLPKAPVVNEYDLGKVSSLVSQFVTLAFGSSGSDLKKNYQITPPRESEMVKIGEDSIKATRLELVPKSSEALKIMTKIDYWVPEGKSYAVKMKLYAPRGDWNTVTYSNIRMNPPTLNEHSVELSAPKTVKHEQIND